MNTQAQFALRRAKESVEAAHTIALMAALEIETRGSIMCAFALDAGMGNDAVANYLEADAAFTAAENEARRQRSTQQPVSRR